MGCVLPHGLWRHGYVLRQCETESLFDRFRRLFLMSAIVGDVRQIQARLPFLFRKVEAGTRFRRPVG
jgi:hypothetical protein